MLSNTSAHADYNEILSWLSGIELEPNTIFITPDNLEAAEALGERIKTMFHWEISIPEYLDEAHL